jgi:hypothetical protein
VVAVGQKLSTLEEMRQGQSCMFHTGYYRNKGWNPDKQTWVPFPTKLFSELEGKHDRRMKQRPDLFVSVRKLQEQRPKSYTCALGLSPSEDFLKPGN